MRVAAATNVDTDDFSYNESVPDMRTTMYHIVGDNSLAHSYSIPYQVADIGDGTVTLNSNKLWMKQFGGGHTTKVPSTKLVN